MDVCRIELRRNSINHNYSQPFREMISTTRKVLRQQRDNKKPLIVEEQTIQWPKNIGQKYQQLFTKHYVYVHRKLKIK